MTLVEFFDFSPIDNLLASLSLEPERLVMVTDREKFSQRRLSEFESFLQLFHPEIALEIRSYKSNVPEDIRKICSAILSEYPQAFFNLTGGGELVASVVTLWAADQKATLFYIDAQGKRIIPITGEDLNTYHIEMPRLTVEQVIALSGAGFKRSDHFQPDLQDEELLTLINKAFAVFLKNQDKWHTLSGYMQQAKRFILPNTNPPRISAQNHFNTAGEHSIHIPTYLLQQLVNAGILQDFQLSKQRVSFTLPRGELIPMLSMHGSLLELYCYIHAAQTNFFDDVKISVIIDGDGPLQDFAEMQNEIDLVCTKGIIPLFISCKSSSPTPLALSEIKLLSLRFGGENARAIMVTAADIYTENPTLHKRAIELGISILDRSDLIKGNFTSRLTAIAKGEE